MKAASLNICSGTDRVGETLSVFLDTVGEQNNIHIGGYRQKGVLWSANAVKLLGNANG